jgi:hypothetical protein
MSPGTKNHDRLDADLALGAFRRSRGLAPDAGVRAMGSSPAGMFHSRCAITRLVAVACPPLSTTATPDMTRSHPDLFARGPRTDHAHRFPLPHQAAVLARRAGGPMTPGRHIP